MKSFVIRLVVLINGTAVCFLPFNIRYNNFRKWYKNEKKAFKISLRIVWRKQKKNYSNSCYFCSIDVSGYDSKAEKVIVYPNLSSANRPVKHVADPPQSIDDILQSSSESVKVKQVLMRLNCENGISF